MRFFPSLRSCFFAAMCMVLCHCASGARAQTGVEQIVQGVSQVCSGGGSGSLFPVDPAWTTVVSGDEDASYPSGGVVVRTYGTGRAAALGHDGWFTNTALVDNLVFEQNLVRWLNGTRGKRVRWASGHAEWAQNLTAVSGPMAGEGYVFSALPGTITPASLANVDVLIVGNAWGAILPSEVEAVRVWVSAGGGLMMAGLGWSWVAYHPALTMDDYPMSKLAEPLGVRWSDDYLSDPSNNIGGSIVFNRVYPNTESFSVAEAESFILATHAAFPASLPQALQSDATLARRFSRAHASLSLPSRNLAESHPLRQNVFDFMRQLVADRAGFYGKNFVYNQTLYPNTARLRERAQRTLRDALPLNPARKTQIADALGMAGVRRALLVEHGLALGDNNRCSEMDLHVLDDMLDTVPASLHNLGFVSVVDYLGTPTTTIDFGGVGGGVNIFGIPAGCCAENGFPADVPATDTDTFSIAWCHELNHVVDAFTVQRTPALDARHQQLLDDAGAVDAEYLRSNVGGAFFQAAPQEFIASISNQWFADTQRVFELALVRFRAGHAGPMNQALFFADVYAQGGLVSHEYRITTSGVVFHSTFSLSRDGQGRIVGVMIGGRLLGFTLDAGGRVIAITEDCDTLDFNRDGVSPDSADIEDLLSVFGGGPCSNDPPTGTGCGDIDFNNDGVAPDSGDIEAYLRVFGGGGC